MKIVILTATLLLPLPALAQGNGTPGAGFIEEWDMSGTGSVSLADMRERRESLFEMFDLDGSAVLDAAEIANMEQTVAAREDSERGQGGHGGYAGGKGPGRAIHAAMTADYNDANGDGQITRAEFVNATDRLFPIVDRDGDGVVTIADFGR